MKRHVLYGLVFLALTSTAFAQEAPTPRKMPRVPVHRESIQDHKSAVPTTREVQGQMTIVDGERLHIGEFDVRLFGVVTPQLSASFGPQARATLDELTAGQNITCLIRDRDREERFLATCRNANNADLAFELLRRGLAVTARGSLASTELATSYLAAEQAASAQKAGLWSVAPAATAAAPQIAADAAAAQAAAAQARAQAAEAATTAKPEQNQANTASATTVKPAATPVVAAAPVNPASAVVYAAPAETFLERYQLLVTGLVMMLTALGLFGAVTIQRIRDQRAEIQALAAALRGELMAAHAVCRARLRSSMDIEDKDISWPRLRSTLYQAYVGRLGWLGAELARRIASIYGQASDYATYYAADDETRTVTLPKRQALQTLVQHIDEVLPRLAIIEHSGNPSSAGATPPCHVAVVVPLSPQAAQTQITLPPATGSSIRRSPGMGMVETPVPVSIPSPAQIWTAVQKLARAPWNKKKNVEVRDPIAEYTALIEEEMKRFSFLEDEDESDTPISTDPATSGWPQKAHEAF